MNRTILRGAVGLSAAVLTVAAVLIVPAQRARAATVEVSIRDNFFDPQEIRIDPGDTVRWVHRGFRTHTVTSDTGLFDSGDLRGGDTFSFTFTKEGVYVYHCRHHGDPGKVGQWGQVVVGGAEVEVIRVPDDFPTIQQAVDAAEPGAHIVVEPGTYREEVSVATAGLVIRGVDRFRTVLRGGDRRGTGFLVTAGGVTIKDFTVRNFTNAGIAFQGVSGFTVLRVDLIKDRTYGVSAVGSSDGLIRRSFGWGSGDSAFHIERCFACGILIDRVTAKTNFMGFSGTNATGVVILNSLFARNGAGVVPNTLPSPSSLTSQGTFVFGNRVRNNNYSTVPAAGFSSEHGIPFGTGVWLFGSRNAVVRENVVEGHDRYGVLVSASTDPGIEPVNNEVMANGISGSGRYDLAWDGSGEDNCFERNQITGETGPPKLQTTYACSARPFEGTIFAPVWDDVRQALVLDESREQLEPAEPIRPRCQRGRPGCRR